MKVLVAGATGYVGRHVVEAFGRCEHDVYVYSRESKQLVSEERCVTTSNTEMHGMFDVVINCARPHWSQFSADQIVNIEQALLADLERFASDRAVKVHTSGVWLFGKASGEDLRHFHFKPLDAVKQDVRTVKRALVNGWHLVYCPSLIYGGEHCQLRRILEEKSHRTIQVPMPSVGHNQYVHVKDVASFYILLATCSKPLSEKQHFIAEEEGFSPLEFATLLTKNGVMERIETVEWDWFEQEYGSEAVEVEKLDLQLPISRHFTPRFKLRSYISQYKNSQSNSQRKDNQ